MADDIVERLRAVSERYRYNTPQHLAENIDAAADEIERLREREQDLRMHAEQDACEIERLRAAGDALAATWPEEDRCGCNNKDCRAVAAAYDAWQEARRG